jgi:hypothetical protein
MRSRNHWLHYCAVVLLGLGLVAAAVELGGSGEQRAVASPPMAPYYGDDELPAYPNAGEFPLGDALTVNGLPMRLSHFSTNDTPAQVRDFYLDAFARMGSKTTIQKTKDGGFAVTAMVNGGDGEAVVVIAPHGHSTEVFPSVFPMSADTAEAQVADSDVPYSANAVGLLKLGDKADGQGEAVNWQEPLLRLAEGAAFIRDEVGRRGWTVTDFNAHYGRGNQARVTATKGGRKASFYLTPYKQQPTGVSVMAQFKLEEVGQ